MAAVLSEVPKQFPSNEVGNGPLLDRFSARRSKELVVAFAGPIGCGIASVISIAEECLRAVGYSAMPLS